MNAYDTVETLLRTLDAPRRNQYFYGKRMDVQHFQMEQDYGRQKQALVNRLTLGKGVVCGLRVSLDEGRIVVDPGVAIDGLGREIVVPVRSSIDPAKPDALCCSDGIQPTRDGRGLFTLWVCHRECSTDFQPALVSDCNSREQCAAGTTVETFCFKLMQGMAQPLGDPAWCAQIGATQSQDKFLAALEGVESRNMQSVRDALKSRRHALCGATLSACDAEEGDPCVPLAVVAVNDARPVALESCLVRPRVYSNAVLLDLILCLAQRLDACCEDVQPAALLRVASIDFLRRGDADGERVVASVESPLAPTVVPIARNTNAIRIRFTKPLARGDRGPSTAGTGETDFQRHNVLVTPERTLENVPFVAGTLQFESADTLRFDLFPDGPYSRGIDLGWQKGRYRIRLAGTDDPGSGRRALADADGVALDGEPAAPAQGAISGEGNAGGDFVASFTIG